MPRWTQNQSDVFQIARINDSMPSEGIVEVTLHDGRSFVGRVAELNAGNNLAQGGGAYYAALNLQILSGETFEVDYLDIARIEGAWERYRDEFEKAGLIKVVG